MRSTDAFFTFLFVLFALTFGPLSSPQASEIPPNNTHLTAPLETGILERDFGWAGQAFHHGVTWRIRDWRIRDHDSSSTLPANLPIRAPLAGTIEIVREMPDGHYALAIAHKYGLRTVLSGLSDIAVTPHTEISQGQALGQIEDSDTLYQELSYNGQPLDPGLALAMDLNEIAALGLISLETYRSKQEALLAKQHAEQTVAQQLILAQESDTTWYQATPENCKCDPENRPRGCSFSVCMDACEVARNRAFALDRASLPAQRPPSVLTASCTDQFLGNAGRELGNIFSNSAPPQNSLPEAVNKLIVEPQLDYLEDSNSNLVNVAGGAFSAFYSGGLPGLFSAALATEQVSEGLNAATTNISNAVQGAFAGVPFLGSAFDAAFGSLLDLNSIEGGCELMNDLFALVQCANLPRIDLSIDLPGLGDLFPGCVGDVLEGTLARTVAPALNTFAAEANFIDEDDPTATTRDIEELFDFIQFGGQL